MLLPNLVVIISFLPFLTGSLKYQISRYPLQTFSAVVGFQNKFFGFANYPEYQSIMIFLIFFLRVFLFYIFATFLKTKPTMMMIRSQQKKDTFVIMNPIPS